MEIINGGVTAAKGFLATGINVGIKNNVKKDMAMVFSRTACVTAGTFTTNKVYAAPVKWDRNVVYNSEYAQAVVINSGVANACTGEEGLNNCKALAAKAGQELSIPADSVLIASTGVIGKQLPMDIMLGGISRLKGLLGEELTDGELAADVQAIVDRGVLRVGVKNAVVGFGFQDTLTGEYSGLEISLAEKIAESLGVDVEFTAVTAATRTELLDSGDIDCVLATFTITDERKQSWDFSTPYFTDYVTVLVEDKSGITSLADLVDKKVGVSSGSTSAKALTKAMIDAGLIDGSGFDADTFDPALWTTGVSFQQYDDYPAISTALSAGEVDAFCVDKSILAIYKTEGRSYIDDKFSPQEYGVATTKGSGLSAYVDELIQGWLADGTIDSLITENGLE